MHLSKRLASTALSLAMFATLIPSYAADLQPGDGSLVPVKVNATAAEFKVKVPTAFPVDVASSGVVTVADNAALVNESKGPIKVLSIATQPANSWELESFASDFQTFKAGTKKMGFKLLNMDVSSGVSYEDPIASAEELPLPYDAKVATQTTAIDENPLKVVFTLGWNELEAPELNMTTMSLEKGETGSLSVKNNSLNSPVSYQSSDVNVATVNADGLVSAVGWGTASITVTVNGMSSICQVTVVKVPTGLTLSLETASISKGGTKDIYPTVTYRAAQDIVWTSSDESVATVSGSNSRGTITAVDYGTATITATMGNFSASCVVTVEQVTLTKENLSTMSDLNGSVLYVYDGVEKISVGTFDGLTVDEIVISPSVAEIEAGAFSGADNLRNITVSSDNQNFESYDGILYTKGKTTLLAYPKARTENSIDIPEGVQHISDNAFKGNISLRTVNFPSTLKTIGNSAFEETRKLDDVVIPEGVTDIGNRAFAQHHVTDPGNYEDAIKGGALMSVTLPSTLKTIGSEAFSAAYKLTNVRLPENIVSIGENAFQYDDYLTLVCTERVSTLPGSPWGAASIEIA